MKYDSVFKHVLSIIIIIVCLASFVIPLFFTQSMNEQNGFILSLFEETSLGWVTGILIYYFGDRFFNRQKNKQINRKAIKRNMEKAK